MAERRTEHRGLRRYPRDPVPPRLGTPYSDALRLRRAFGDRVRTVTVDSGGHDAHLADGNACGDALVTEFLVTEVPVTDRRVAADTRCP